ncbi:MAG TPA: hypothetical protein VLS87_10290 [Woeseiaceae bacterium]|nr:hypothetical protein [Woeseiaceae bacterium]
MLPLTSIETRWFFAGGAERHPGLRRWFETSTPFPRAAGIGAPEWRGRAGGAPDVYLLMPGCTDMGVKWREGTLQVKGRVEDLGARRFGDRHQGRVQRWIKWTYAEVPAACRALFADGERHGLATASVHKTRALRLFSLEAAGPREVAPGEVLDRGVGFEMTDLQLDGIRHCSIAFEAFPDDAVTAAGFDAVVTGFLRGLADTLALEASMAYPDWLCA